MTKRIVFVGNCQMEVIRTLYDRFVAGVTGDQTHFLPSWAALDAHGTKILETADLLVDQVQSFSRELDLPPGLSSIRRVPVPLVSAGFLWPFAGTAHPLNAPTPYLQGGPYPGELGDVFLNRMIANAVPAERALQEYRAHDLGGASSLNRRFELLIEQQRQRDEICDFSVAPVIEQNVRAEPLFLSPHHPGLRITVTLASRCLYQIGAPPRCIEMLTRDLRQSPFPRDELPIHPTVAAHFGLRYIRPETTFELRGEGRYSWDQWVLRYMSYDWSPELFEGWSLAGSNPGAARQLLARVVERFPRSPLAHAGLAKAFLAIHELEPASAHIAEAVKLAPHEPEFLQLAAFVASAIGQRDKAVHFAKESVTYDAGSIGGLQLLAKLQENAADFTGAEETRRISVDLRPNDAGLLTDLGTTLSHLKRLDAALDCYQRAAVIAPDQSGSHFGASLILAQLGRTEEALQAVDRAIALRPGVAAYLSHRGHLLLRLGRQDDAVVALRSALEHDPDNTGLHNAVTDILLRDHMSQGALYHAIRTAACAPGVARYQIRVAHLLTRHMRVVDAIEAYRRAIELQPNDWRLHAELGALFVRLDRLEEAVAELNRALEIDAQGQVAFELSGTLLRMGKLAAAQEAIDRAVQLAPDQPPFRARQAEIEDVIAGRRMNLVASRFLAEQSTVILGSEEFLAPACIRYTNFPEVNPQFGKHHVTTLYIERRRWVPDISLCQLPADTTLAVPNGEDFIPLVGGQVVAEQIRRDWQYQSLVEAIGECARDGAIPQQAVLIGRYGVRTWGHWLGELLPKVVAVESRWPGRFSFIVPDRFVSDPVHKTALESLAYYGIGQDRLVLAAERTKYLCANLYVVSPVWSTDTMLHPRIAALMRENGPHDPEPATGWLKAALLRRGTRTRNIQNIADVEKILVGHGFSFVDIEKLNFRQQVEMFRNASAIACVLGSGLTGLMYAPSGVKVLTLAPAEWGDSFFYSMMQERDAVFADIRGPTAAKEGSSVGTSGFTVSPEAVLAGVRAIGLGDDGADGGPQTAIVGPPAISDKRFGSTDEPFRLDDFSILVSVEHEAAMIGDTLNTLPFILTLAKKYNRRIHVQGAFNKGVRPLVADLPISFDEVPNGGVCVFYSANIKKSWDHVGPRGLHMAQGHFVLAGMTPPGLPISLPLRAERSEFPAGIVISPFCGSESQEPSRHVRVWFVDRWNAVIDSLLQMNNNMNIYIVGGQNDNPAPFMRSGVVPVIGRPLPQVLDLLQRAALCISIDTGISHLAHYGGVSKHVLLYSPAVMLNTHQNPLATVIQAWPGEISPTMVLDASIK